MNFKDDADCIIVAEEDGVIVGSLILVHDLNRRAMIKWLLEKPGYYLKPRLIDKAIKFSKGKYDKLMIERYAYINDDEPDLFANGFELVKEEMKPEWGGNVVLKHYQRKI